METLIFIIALFALGFYVMPAFVWFVFIGTYSFVFFDMGLFFWTLFLIAAILLLYKPMRRMKNIEFRM